MSLAGKGRLVVRHFVYRAIEKKGPLTQKTSRSIKAWSPLTDAIPGFDQRWVSTDNQSFEYTDPSCLKFKISSDTAEISTNVP